VLPTMSRKKSKAVVLLSGGLDSATTLYYARKQGYETICLIFDYGQRHRREIRHALKVARKSGSHYRLERFPLGWQGSALLDKKIKLPHHRRISENDIPVTYVPARNIIFLSFAASFAEVIGAKKIFIGANAIDYSGYPDCRPKFYAAFQKVLKEGLKSGAQGRTIEIETPLINLTKVEIIRLGEELGVPYNLTWSCYAGGNKPCGKCDSCLIRAKGFAAAGVPDPAIG